MCIRDRRYVGAALAIVEQRVRSRPVIAAVQTRATLPAGSVTRLGSAVHRGDLLGVLVDAHPPFELERRRQLRALGGPLGGKDRPLADVLDARDPLVDRG